MRHDIPRLYHELHLTCFRDWTLHTCPSPAHPSYRLITALRLYALALPGTIEITHTSLQAWKDTILGTRDCVSGANEEAWRDLLLKLCEQLAASAREQLLILEGTGGEASVVFLWREQLFVADAVAESVKRGIEF